MKAISLKQPWASWVANGSKSIETRTWKTPYRGELLICSTKKPTLGQGLPNGVALCVVKILRCRPMVEADEEAARCKIYEGAWAWDLEFVGVVADPFPVKGQLGFFDVAVEFRASRPVLSRVLGKIE